MHTVSLIVHVFAAAVFVGPQVVMFFAVTPASWLIDDERLRRDVMRVIAGRFGILAGAALVLLLLTGLYQFFSVVPEPVREDMNAFRFGPVFMLKMLVLTALLALLAVHTLVFARRVRSLSDEFVRTGDEETGFALEQQRRNSFVVSFFLLVASLAVLALGVTLGHHEYAYQQS